MLTAFGHHVGIITRPQIAQVKQDQVQRTGRVRRRESSWAT